MVSYEERIAAMMAAGQLSATQAEDMLKSVREVSRAVPIQQRRQLPVGAVAIAAVVACALAYIIFGGNDAAQTEVIQNVDQILNKPNEVGAMSQTATKSISVFVILLPLVLSVLGFMGLYNSLVNKEEEVLSSWSQVESNYQRRADLIPGLVSTVKSFMDHESKVMANVTAERTDGDLGTALAALEKSQAVASDELAAAKGAGDVAIILEDDARLAKIAATQKEVGTNLTRIMGLVEAYPQLRSADSVITLQDQLEGTENRINVARMVFNEAVKDYNSSIRKMPGSLVAGFGDFKRKAYFEADAGAEKAVKIDLE